MEGYRTYDQLGTDAIEKWAEELDKAPRRKFTSEESEVFISMVGIENKGYDRIFLKMWHDLKNEYNGVSLLCRRLPFHDYTMSKAAQVACGMMVGSPGEMVMMVNFLQYKCFKHKTDHVDMKSLSMMLLADGWFGNEILKEFWEKQKYVSSDRHLLNMLDNREYGISIRLHQ